MNSYGRASKQVQAAGSGDSDAAGDATTLGVTLGTGLNYTTTYTYDGQSRVIETTIAYDRNSNPTSTTNNVHSGFVSGLRFQDNLYTLDGLNRVTLADQGNLSGGTITGRTRKEAWPVLDLTGNWIERTLDHNGDGSIIGLADRDEQTNKGNSFNTANEWLDSDQKKETATGYDKFVPTYTYDANGHQTADEVAKVLTAGAGTTYERRFFTYDPFGRMTAVHSDSAKTVLIAEYRYNGLGQRIMWRYDQNANGTVASTERYFYMYDNRWRIVGVFLDSGSTPKESFVYHAAGNAGRGSSSYIDSIVMRDRDALGDATLEERRYYVQNWRADVVAVTKSNGDPLQYVVYSPYGEAITHALADVDLDGDVDSNDQTAWANGAPNSTFAYAALEDINHDGTDSAADDSLFDESYNDNLGLSGRGRLSSGKLDNRKGYAGYEHDESLTMYHVRHRVYRPDLGRWMTRDPLGYVDGMGLYEYVGGMAVRGRDPSGLRAEPCIGGVCHPSAPVKPVVPEIPPGHEDPGLSIEQCNQCARQAESQSGNSGLIREMRRRGCNVSINCRDCEDEEGGGTSKGWTEPDGTITLCANRMPSCDYAKTMLAHELWHAYDFCQNNFPLEPSCCDCVCYELRAYRWDRGCADGGIRRSRPGPNGEPAPTSEWECLRMYVGLSCTGDRQPCASAGGSAIDACFAENYFSSNCAPISIVPVVPPIVRPGPPREI